MRIPLEQPACRVTVVKFFHGRDSPSILTEHQFPFVAGGFVADPDWGSSHILLEVLSEWKDANGAQEKSARDGSHWISWLELSRNGSHCTRNARIIKLMFLEPDTGAIC